MSKKKKKKKYINLVYKKEKIYPAYVSNITQIVKNKLFF